MRAIAVLLMLLAVPAWAQESQVGDSRFKIIDYRDGGIVTLPTSPDTGQMLLFAPGERIESIILGDPNAYLVTVAGSGDSLSLRANGRPMPTMMRVRTELRSYEIELVMARTGAAPQVIRFFDVVPVSISRESPTPPALLAGVSYRLSGDKMLRPASISDDGRKTYLAWREDQAVPAIFAIGPTGEEEMVDGYVRAGIFTIDRVYQKLVFRIDRKMASARRQVARARKK